LPFRFSADASDTGLFEFASEEGFELQEITIRAMPAKMSSLIKVVLVID
jgi:hypothetical protein